MAETEEGPSYFEIAEAGNRLMTPITAEKLQIVGEICGLNSSTVLLDLACGKGEMLCQWSHRFGITGVGVDSQEPFLDVARRRAAELAVTDRVSFDRAEVSPYLTENTDTFGVVSCLGATFVGGGFAGAVEMMKPLRESSRSILLIGEPFWHLAPPKEANSGWGESASMASILEQADSAGLEIIEMVQASQDDFDRYQAAQWKAISDWVADHPDDPSSKPFSERMVRGRDQYLRFQRSHLGWGVFVLRERN